MAAISYKEQSITGVQWRRYSAISISNPYNQQPTFSIEAENVVSLPGVDQVLRVGGDNMHIAFDPMKHINLRNPTTDELLGTTISEAEIYAILYSVCRQLDDEASGGV